MAILNNTSIDILRWMSQYEKENGTSQEKTDAINCLSLIDTIDDRDRQVEKLERRLRGGHDSDCQSLGVFNPRPCSCGKGR